MATPLENLNTRKEKVSAEIASFTSNTPDRVRDAAYKELDMILKALANPAMSNSDETSPIAAFEVRSRMLT